MNDAEIKNPYVDDNILTFVGENLAMLEDVDHIIAYCEGITKRTASVDRFAPVDVSDLVKTYKKLFK